MSIEHRRDRADRTEHIDHGIARELLLIALVLAMGILAAVVIVLPAVVSG